MRVKESATSVPDLEHGQAAFDWNDLQLFMLVARSGSLRRASKLANRSVNSLRRRLQHLEYELNCRLLVRDASGTRLTDDGRRLRSVGEDMFQASFDVAREFVRARRDQSAPVSIECDPSLANNWLIPKAVGFLAGRPDIALDVRTRAVESHSGVSDCDLCVLLTKPNHKYLTVTRLGYLHFQPFASREFIKRHGYPGHEGEVRRFKLVERALVAGDDAGWRQVLSDPSDIQCAITASCSSTCLSAVVQGVGIGLLPTFFRESDARLVPVLEGLNFRRDIFLSYRPEVADHRHVRSTIHWVKSVFEAQRTPWFAADFFSPSDFGLE